MRLRTVFTVLVVLGLAASAHAEIKVYNASRDNGTPGDIITNSVTIDPPLQTTPDTVQGSAVLEDDGLGTVTLNDLDVEVSVLIDYGEDLLTMTQGPGAFIFIDTRRTNSIGAPHVSDTLGENGPSGTDPTEATEWGIVSGWALTGFEFCLSSPPTLCDQAGFAHGATIAPVLPSDTYDLGTWTFDAVGDYEASQWYITRTNNGGLSNTNYLLRGAFQGSGLPALPLVGFGALALSLAAIGGRTLLGRR
jgi:hypothetical protein